MKDEEIQFIPRNDRKPEPAETASDSQEPDSTSKVSIKIPSGVVGDIFWMVVSAVIALAVYCIGVAVMSEKMNFFLRHFIGLIIGLMFLAAFNSVQKTAPVLGRTVVILLLVLFIYNISNHYFVSSADGSGNQTQTGQTVRSGGATVSPSRPTEDMPADSVLVLPAGESRFVLVDSASTGWLTIPKNGRFSYSISSKNYNYKIIFSDGAEYRGKPDAVIPWREKPVFKIQAFGKDSVIVMIKRI